MTPEDMEWQYNWGDNIKWSADTSKKSHEVHHDYKRTWQWSAQGRPTLPPYMKCGTTTSPWVNSLYYIKNWGGGLSFLIPFCFLDSCLRNAFTSNLSRYFFQFAVLICSLLESKQSQKYSLCFFLLFIMVAFSLLKRGRYSPPFLFCS